ncbi:MAG: LuxR C-terminal-related transcriptional regulator [bacterium]|nr:LuxR C-terminal-related transcriptional regulator [bacterium]
MISTQFMVIGNGSESTFQVVEYLSGKGTHYTSVPLSRHVPFGILSPEARHMAFVCTDNKSEAQALYVLEELTERGIVSIVVHDDCNPRFQQSAVQAGAADVLAMPLRNSAIEDALDIAFYREEIEQHQSSMEQHAILLSQLSPRERRIVCLAARGLPNKQIARAIGRSIKSVERLRRQAYDKLQVRSTADMTRVVLLGSLFECRSSRIFTAN